MIKNRIEKNFKKLKPWSDKYKIEAFRIYDRDIPEFPFMIDKYADCFVVYDRTHDEIDQNKNQFPQVIAALVDLFSCKEENIFIKRRQRQKGLDQYEKYDQAKKTFTIQEEQARLIVNLSDYLDTGLFLDHRPMRQKIFRTARGKKFLNLFCYTGAVSVFAALGGAETTSVDMSNTYLQWAEENFAVNRLLNENHKSVSLSENNCSSGSVHRFVRADVVQYLQSPVNEKYDLIFLDPPTFSNSKRMQDEFDVERDQEFLVESCMKRLNPDGVLYFSNNKRKFKLSPLIPNKFNLKDISLESIPVDFHDKKIHCCFQIQHKR